uniref:LITAF domain-containing protein n=1 Tax=Amphiprion percula TaxID=161767 RepID=A0A3P8U9V4_AMPPE
RQLSAVQGHCKHSFVSPHVSIASATPPSAAVAEFMSSETSLCCSPTLTACSSCRTQVITEVTFKVGTQAWLICLVFVLVLGCCLISFFINPFKDTYHSCPRCGRFLHVHRKTCCQ